MSNYFALSQHIVDILNICTMNLSDLNRTMKNKLNIKGGINKMNCPNCGSTKIENGVSIGLSAESGNVGPNFKKGFFIGVAQMYCDICLDCGEVTRFFIKESTDKKWVKSPGSLGSK